MYCCESCLEAIESHEGPQFHRPIVWDTKLYEHIKEDDDGNEFLVCEWCEDECGLDEMVEVMW